MIEASTHEHYLVPLWKDSGTLPVFQGESFDDHVAAWRAVDTSIGRHLWAQAAVAASLVRHAGARTDRRSVLTERQRFYKEVGVTAAHVSRLAKTHATFTTEPVDTDVKRMLLESPLSFSHWLIAANYASDPIAAITHAHDLHWSTPEMRRQLSALRKRERAATTTVTPTAVTLESQRTVRLILDVDEHRQVAEACRALAQALGLPSGSSMQDTIVAVFHRARGEWCHPDRPIA